MNHQFGDVMYPIFYFIMYILILTKNESSIRCRHVSNFLSLYVYFDFFFTIS